LRGAPREPWEKFELAAVSALCSRHNLDEESARHLIGRYGRCALDVASYLERDRSLAEPVLPGEPELRVEFAYQRAQEMAIYPADCLLRRTRLGLFRPGLLTTALPAAGS
jgi:glycerol-3-phosphate dehydrogenase